MNHTFYHADEFAVTVDRTAGLCRTLFADGTSVPACPHDTDEYRATAARHGYGGDLGALSREHELCHHLLALRTGRPYSPTLWAVGHDFVEGTASLTSQHEEESLVLDFQSALNGLPVTTDLRSRLPDIESLLRSAASVLRPEKAAWSYDLRDWWLTRRPSDPQ